MERPHLIACGNEYVLDEKVIELRQYALDLEVKKVALENRVKELELHKKVLTDENEMLLESPDKCCKTCDQNEEIDSLLKNNEQLGRISISALKIFEQTPGLTLRDWFAGMAMSAEERMRIADDKKFAEWCYKIADAMIAAGKVEDA